MPRPVRKNMPRLFIWAVNKYTPNCRKNKHNVVQIWGKVRELIYFCIDGCKFLCPYPLVGFTFTKNTNYVPILITKH